MKPPTVYAIQLYRQNPGDLSIGDAPAFEPFDEAKRAARERLAAFFNDQRRRPRDKPTMGRIIDAASLEVLDEFRMTPNGVSDIGAPSDA